MVNLLLVLRLSKENKWCYRVSSKERRLLTRIQMSRWEYLQRPNHFTVRFLFSPLEYQWAWYEGRNQHQLERPRQLIFEFPTQRNKWNYTRKRYWNRPLESLLGRVNTSRYDLRFHNLFAEISTLGFQPRTSVLKSLWCLAELFSI